MITLLLTGCIETTIGEIPIPPVATPPVIPNDDRGDPPDWNDCGQGFIGRYTNLSADHPFVEPLPDEGPLLRTDLDWWDQTTFQEFSATLDYGANWWPVDEGLAGDPAYFAVHWSAWLRAWDDTTLVYTLGSADDVWIEIGNEEVLADSGVKPFEPQTYRLNVDAGQYPLDVYYAHRSGDSGFRFRVLEGDVSICYAQYE